MDELREFVLWLNDYVERDIDAALYQVLDSWPCSNRDALKLGHSYALVAITGALEGLVEARTTATPEFDRLREGADFVAAFRKLFGLREAGAGGSNPLTPTNKIKDIDVN